MARTVKKVEKPKHRELKEVPRRELYPTGEAVILLCCSKPYLYEVMDSGQLKYIIRGNRRYVPAFAISDYLHQQVEQVASAGK